MKKLEINIPEGHEIDLDKSNLSKGIVFFKEVKKVLTYEDVAKKLLNDKKGYYINNLGLIKEGSLYDECHAHEPNSAASREQLESILALNKLCNVAKYLNGDWLPEFEDNTDDNYSIEISELGQITAYKDDFYHKHSKVYFKTKELAQQAIEILGEEEIRKALTLNH